jgi:hypothetical protein
MAKPTVRVRIGFADGPYVASPTWTDVTSYVRSISTNRGRTDDWQHFDTGTASVELDNRDRRFDPTYTSSPYYPNVSPRRQIIIDGTVDGSSYYVLFRGFIAGWPVKLSAAGYDSTVTIDCFDALGLLSATEITPDYADAYITTLAPKHYWKCNESTGSTTIYDYGSVGLNIPVFSGRPTLVSVPSIAKGIPYNAASVAVTTYYATQTTTSNTGDFTLVCWYVGTLDGTPPITVQGLGSVIFSLTGSSIQADVDNGAGSGARVITSRSGFSVGEAHHLALTYTASSGALRIWIDGQDLTGSQTNLTGIKIYPLTQVTLARGALAQVQFYNSVLTDTNITTIYKLSAAQIIETTSARFERLMANTQYPNTLQEYPGSAGSTIPAPSGTVADISVGKFALISELQTVSDSEGGDIYVSRSGVLRMTNRTYATTNSTSITSQATLGVAGIPIQTEIDYEWSADNMRNTINVEWSGGAVVTASNSSSVTTYGTAAESYTTQLSTATDATSLANYLNGFGYLPRLIISAVRAGQASSTVQWAQLLGLDLLDRITVVISEQVGSNLTQTQLVQAISHSITPGDWQMTVLGSARYSSVFTIGTSYLDGTDILG